MTAKLKRKGENWHRRLPRPIHIKGGRVLRILGDCRSYALDLDPYTAAELPWQRAAALMLDAAAGGDLEEVCLQFERILIHQGKLLADVETKRK